MEAMQKYLIQRKAEGITQAYVADMLGVSPGYLSEMVHGKKTPGLRLAFQIESLTGGAVPASSWVSE